MKLTKEDYITLLSLVIEVRKRDLDMPEELLLIDLKSKLEGLEKKLNSEIMSFLPY